MVKKLSTLIVFLFLFLLSYNRIGAQEVFYTDLSTKYKLDEEGTAYVVNNLTLENALSEYHATTYKFKLNSIQAENIKVTQNNSQINYRLNEESDEYTVIINFPDYVVGKGKKRNFQISYESADFAKKTGEVWEISIPRIKERHAFRDYTARLVVPKTFGNEAYISPLYSSYADEESNHVYEFEKDDLEGTAISAGFGKFQVFEFNLNYHLENPLKKSSAVEIAIPPDTPIQKVYLQEISPEPVSIRIDGDGNWLAKYNLDARQRIDVSVIGAVQVFNSARSFVQVSDNVVSENLKADEYWEVDSPKFQNLAKTYNSPEKIYEYVVETLSYDYDRVKPNVDRKGAKKALENPDESICLEFTDLFVTIARAAGIPAREVNGYALTDDTQLKPLSLVADVLHSWPEYYDEQKSTWIPVDPTWGSTSNIDYFHSFDLKHITFVIHGTNSREPYPPGSYKLGPEPKRDVFVRIGQLPEVRNSDLNIQVKSSISIPFTSKHYEVSIDNPGPVSLYNVPVDFLFDNKIVKTFYISILPPFSTHKTGVDIPYGLLATKTPENVMVSVQSKEVVIPTEKQKVITWHLLIISSSILIFVVIFLVKSHKIKIPHKFLNEKN